MLVSAVWNSNTDIMTQLHGFSSFYFGYWCLVSNFFVYTESLTNEQIESFNNCPRFEINQENMKLNSHQVIIFGGGGGEEPTKKLEKMFYLGSWITDKTLLFPSNWKKWRQKISRISKPQQAEWIIQVKMI